MWTYRRGHQVILVASTVQYPTLCIYLLGVVDTPGEAVASGRAMTTAAIYWHQTLEPRNCQGYAGNRFRVTFACTSDYSSASYLNRNRAKWIYTVRYLSLPTLDEQRPVLTLTSSFETRLSHICGTAIRLKNGQSKLNFNDLRQFQIASLTQSIIA